MNRDETWGALRARSESAGFWNEILARKEKYVKDGNPPKDAKRFGVQPDNSPRFSKIRASFLMHLRPA